MSETKLKCGWQITYHGESYSDCDLDSFIFSDIKKDDTVEIAAVIPEEIPDREALLVYEEYHDIHVFLDGREVFTREAERLKEGLPLASGFYLCDIGEMEAGDPLVIRVTAGRDNAFDSIHYPSIVNGTTFYQDYMSSHLLLLVQLVSFIVIGTFMAIFAMVMTITVFKGTIDGFRLVSLSLFSIAIGVWILCRENLFEIFSDEIIVKEVMRLLAFYLFPVFYIGYQFGKMPEESSVLEKRAYRIRNMIFGVEWLLSIIIYAYVCYAVLVLHRYATDFLTLYHILFAVVIFTAVFAGIYDLIKKRRRYAVSTIATLIVGGVALADLLIFYSMTFDSNTGRDTHVTGPIYYALIFLILSFAWEFIVNTTRDMKAETKRAEMYGREKELAERSNKAKSAFLANMSHEIRTPINTVLGLNTMIMRESSESQIREYSRDIQSAGRSLLSIINDILDSSKIESGRMEIVPVKYYFTGMLHDTVSMVYAKAEQKGLKFKLDISEHIPKVLIGDDVRIRQIIVNLLTNAVKYTNEGSVELRINASPESDGVVLHVRVKDTGIGIRKEDLSHLFEKFVRVDMEKNRSIEGTGLGMSICTQLLALMGSELKVESEYGRGSEFWFDLKQGVDDWSPAGKYEGQDLSTTGDDIYQVSVIAPDANILVVDDNDMNRKVFCSLIKGTKVKVSERGSSFRDRA